MGFMLPTTADIGARLAAILPTGLIAMARGASIDPESVLAEWLGEGRVLAAAGLDRDRIAPVRSFVMIVVDGLGHANLQARLGHAPALASLQRRRIETVAPSTTGAALTTLTTGELPGSHGLIGYRIMHPRLGLRTTLSEWEGITAADQWQRATPLFAAAGPLGARAVVAGRPAHAEGGLTGAILSGAEYLPGQRIEDRFAAVSRVVRGADPVLAYLYVDELDRAAHADGWQSAAWTARLEQLDAALESFLRALPSDVGVILTADHGMVDVSAHQQVVLDEHPGLLEGVAAVGGEPRCRSLYLHDPADASAVAARIAAAEGKRAWVATRDEAIDSGVFGPVSAEVGSRLGDVIVAARKQVAYYTSSDDPQSRHMIGQHGSFTDEERGVPLAVGGAFAGTGIATAITGIAAARLAELR